MREQIKEVLWLLLLLGAIIAITTLMLASQAAGAQPLTRPRIEALARQAARRNGVDENLMLAVIAVESNFNPNARGTHGEIGLMQLRPEFHPSVPLHDPVSNLDAGARYLRAVWRACSGDHGGGWILCYNRGPFAKIPRDYRQDSYFKRITAEIRKQQKQAPASSQQFQPWTVLPYVAQQR